MIVPDNNNDKDNRNGSQGNNNGGSGSIQQGGDNGNGDSDGEGEEEHPPPFNRAELEVIIAEGLTTLFHEELASLVSKVPFLFTSLSLTPATSTRLVRLRTSRQNGGT